MEQQRIHSQPLTVEQYKQQMMELGRRGGQQARMEPPPALTPAPVPAPIPAPALPEAVPEAIAMPEMSVMPQAEPAMARAEPYIDLALRAGLAAPQATAPPQVVVPAEALAPPPPAPPPPPPSFAQPLAPQPTPMPEMEAVAASAMPTAASVKPCPVHGGAPATVVVRCRRCGFPTAPRCRCVCGQPPRPPAKPGSKPRTAAEPNAPDELDLPLPAAEAVIPAKKEAAIAMMNETLAIPELPAIPEMLAAAAPQATAAPQVPPVVAYNTLNGVYEPYINPVTGGEYVALPKPSYASLEDFLAQNTGRGQLTVRAADMGGGPLPGASVRVTQDIDGVRYVFYDVAADQNGEAARLSLPAPPKERSFEPPVDSPPYALYDVTVTGAGGANVPSVQFRNVSIFADTESVQDAQLAPGRQQVIDEMVYAR